MRAWLREWLRKTLERFSNGSVAESVMMKKKMGTRGGVQNHANKQKNDFHNSDRKKIQPGTNTSF